MNMQRKRPSTIKLRKDTEHKWKENEQYDAIKIFDSIVLVSAPSISWTIKKFVMDLKSSGSLISLMKLREIWSFEKSIWIRGFKVLQNSTQTNVLAALRDYITTRTDLIKCLNCTARIEILITAPQLAPENRHASQREKIIELSLNRNRSKVDHCKKNNSESRLSVFVLFSLFYLFRTTWELRNFCWNLKPKPM